MPKRRLTEQQQKRIRANRLQTSADSLEHSKSYIEGQVIARFTEHATLEFTGENGIERCTCYLRANLQVKATSSSTVDYKNGLVAGDKVLWQTFDQAAIESDSPEFNGVITEVLPRSSVLLRPDNRGKLRLVAANIQYIGILIAPIPEPHFNLVDRYIVAAENQNIQPVLVFNKCDLLNSKDIARLNEKLQLYQQLGYPSFIVSAHKGTGLDEASMFFRDKTGIFVGQSGVGKSSLLKRLCPDFDDEIGLLSTAKSGKTKGKHTTTTSRLYHLPFGGSVIDSPGIREFGLWHLTPLAVSNGFKEISSASRHCRFRDCQHRSEPGCAVLSDVAAGKINTKRIESYRHILSSLEQS